jgi:ribonuclease P protein component
MLNELNYNRLGFSISKKIGKAVIRNRIKRLLREALGRLLHGVPLNYDFVIIAKKPSVEAGLDEFVRDIKKTLIKVEEFNDVSLQRT